MESPWVEAIRRAYRQSVDEEMLEPHVLVDERGRLLGRINPGDAVIFYDIRGEREIELTESLTLPNFDKFPTSPLGLHFVTMIEYAPHLPVAVAFPPLSPLTDTLSDVLAANGIKQVKITEAEKAAHVTFFLSGKKRRAGHNEETVIVPTRRDVTLFDESPEMSLEDITTVALGKIAADHDFIFVNFPNADVLGHIENEGAILQALATVDRHTGVLVAAARARGMDVVICADHGSVEKWRYPDGSPDTGHTDSPVPFVLISDDFHLAENIGELADVAPSILSLFDIPAPPTMTGRCLLQKKHSFGGEKRRVLCLLLDGWGMAADGPANLIAKAATPVMDELLRRYPHARLQAAGVAVGLPEGTVGNSEAGHLHLGAGRRVYSDRLRIDRAIATGDFARNEAFLGAMEHSLRNNTALHLIGIVSFFSSHGALEHLFALVEMARRVGVGELYLHAMLGRRGELPESGARYIAQVEEKLREMSLGKVVSVIGRYWSLDREENWDRIEKTYRMLVQGEGVAVREKS